MTRAKRSAPVATLPFDTERAACKSARIKLFFPESPHYVPSQAAKLCSDCPLKVPCLAYALKNPSLVGVWGGTSAEDRRKLRRRRTAMRG